MGPLSTIDSVLAAYENTSNPQTRHSLRAECEALLFYSSRGYGLLYHRHRFAGVELDLIFSAPEGHIVFVEVKTLKRESRREYRLSGRQKARLQMAKSYFESVFRLPTEVRVAYFQFLSGAIDDLVIL